MAGSLLATIILLLATTHEQDAVASGSKEAEIIPFRIAVSDAVLRDLHERLARTRWPDAAATSPRWNSRRSWRMTCEPSLGSFSDRPRELAP
jgi:hypothetical protein